MPEDLTAFSFMRPMVDDTEDYARSQETDDIEGLNQYRGYGIRDPSSGVSGRRGVMGGLDWYERIKDS